MIAESDVGREDKQTLQVLSPHCQRLASANRF